jgi:hypothetical protein
MNTSKFSTPFMEKNPLSPLQGNAFIKAKMEAEAAGKSNFTVDGKNYPLKMVSPLNDNHKEDPKKIIGEQTFEFEKDKPSGNYVAGLSLDIDKSAQPSDTDDRLVITPKQKRKMEKNKVMNQNFIDQYEKMKIKKDSVSGGKNFYSIKK